MSDDTDYADLSSRHHCFLQTFINRKIIEQTTLDKITSAINAYYKSPQQSSNQYINDLNPYLIDFHIQIKTAKSQGKNYWALVNLKADEYSKLATYYQPSDTIFFKAIIEKLVQNGGEISNNECLNLGKAAKAGGSTKVEEILNTFIQDNWLRKSEDKARVTLAERSIIELQPMLVDLPDCYLCSQKVLTEKGVIEYQCSHDDCAIQLHTLCAKQWFSTHTKSNPCPNCKKPFK
ncbi:hypothetical protein DLAC_02911 [Tieghemostelium lacteum]|uniref:Non-structural maintenance of chromosomes element 1 homolog n=1 Tax=Tieghemostelium lacteum TaxID=361077 RepID=A0A152A3S4_TIELA|nr:hypothetical protein DLAC_02911 [Tieghemostelium lacteum]|eukprot:KYR00854.1 hypothetical protein DLAC_02911 [Tieghemostelium lacteum]